MKNLFILLGLLLSLGLMTSCSSSEEAPVTTDCNITVTFDNVAVVNGIIYATQTYPLKVESISFSSATGTTKSISQVEYAIDSRMNSRSSFAPYKGRFDTRTLESGTHTLGMFFGIVQLDNTVLPDNVQYVFTVVPSLDDLPEGAELGTYTQRFRVTPD
ncbi:MAG: hypothetical protein K2J70_08590 [Muribaculaceae bacterium]|nr:hypothetical protein [Muribaculaceae bacterium]